VPQNEFRTAIMLDRALTSASISTHPAMMQ
jgi:hypothetical protein